jgi:predicted Zn-dependent protease
LQVEPDNAVAHHNLEVLALQNQQPAMALSNFRDALDADPTCPQFLLSYICALVDARQPDAAHGEERCPFRTTMSLCRTLAYRSS